MKLGDLAPDFALPGVDGAVHHMTAFADRPVLCVVFMCNHCPYVKATIDRLIALQRDYAGRGVQLVGINANDTTHHPEDDLPHMIAWAKAKEFSFPYLRDETQEVARAYGAERTPQLFVFDRDRYLRYTGAIDNNTQDPAKVTRRYLREAIDALLANRPVAEAETHAVGCTVKWA